MTSATSKGAFQPDSDVHITYEDQQRINEFARHNARFEDYKEELKNKQTELANLDDAFVEIELLDETEKVPFLMGELFLFQNMDETMKSLEETKQKIMDDISTIQKKQDEVLGVMSDLKTLLYAKFGNHINLEPDEE